MNQTVKTVREKLNKVKNLPSLYFTSELLKFLKNLEENISSLSHCKQIEESGNQKRSQPSSQTQPDLKRTRVDNRRRI